MVRSQDMAEAAATDAYELKKHLPCLMKKFGVVTDPTEIPDLYPTYCTYQKGEGEPKKGPPKEGSNNELADDVLGSSGASGMGQANDEDGMSGASGAPGDGQIFRTGQDIAEDIIEAAQ